MQIHPLDLTNSDCIMMANCCFPRDSICIKFNFFGYWFQRERVRQQNRWEYEKKGEISNLVWNFIRRMRKMCVYLGQIFGRQNVRRANCVARFIAIIHERINVDFAGLRINRCGHVIGQQCTIAVGQNKFIEYFAKQWRWVVERRQTWFVQWAVVVRGCNEIRRRRR